MSDNCPAISQPAPCLVVDLAAYRAASPAERNKIAKPLFKPSAWPDNDFRMIGNLLDDAASSIRKGQFVSPDAMAKALNTLAVSARKAACGVAEMEKRVRKDTKARMEKRLRKATKKLKKARA